MECRGEEAQLVVYCKEISEPRNRFVIGGLGRLSKKTHLILNRKEEGLAGFRKEGRGGKEKGKSGIYKTDQEAAKKTSTGKGKETPNPCSIRVLRGGESIEKQHDIWRWPLDSLGPSWEIKEKPSLMRGGKLAPVRGNITLGARGEG